VTRFGPPVGAPELPDRVDVAVIGGGYCGLNAALELARPLDGAARAIRLAIPLDKSLRAKRNAMEAALGAYGKAEEYGVAQVSTAATYAMADLYRNLGNSLLDSERPRKLSAEELEQYNILLEEQAFPFEEKAIGIHARNTRRAAEGIWDSWIEKSYADLAVMQPGRYARPEITGGPDAPATTAPRSRRGCCRPSACARWRGKSWP